MILPNKELVIKSFMKCQASIEHIQTHLISNEWKIDSVYEEFAVILNAFNVDLIFHERLLHVLCTWSFVFFWYCFIRLRLWLVAIMLDYMETDHRLIDLRRVSHRWQ